jgi:hypothetical protein
LSAIAVRTTDLLTIDLLGSGHFQFTNLGLEALAVRRDTRMTEDSDFRFPFRTSGREAGHRRVLAPPHKMMGTIMNIGSLQLLALASLECPQIDAMAFGAVGNGAGAQTSVAFIDFTSARSESVFPDAFSAARP